MTKPGFWKRLLAGDEDLEQWLERLFEEDSEGHATDPEDVKQKRTEIEVRLSEKQAKKTASNQGGKSSTKSQVKSRKQASGRNAHAQQQQRLDNPNRKATNKKAQTIRKYKRKASSAGNQESRLSQQGPMSGESPNHEVSAAGRADNIQDRVDQVNRNLDTVFADIENAGPAIETNYRVGKHGESKTRQQKKLSLRQAILAKEILSEPKALRNRRR
ncbi:hypothetical protein [Aerococcus kribbianus]|uniref:Uncharacterized protein n=1 Tax=Aerococcus kribbianus TaxID=2999064 RepID=A0A9X3JGD6_9LACT|nr:MULTISPECIES: hypothetical protein [unclassified Aerococcus]MCZ0717126.1 hypothetical protein [Aerococcus sp. YH-aer221]MCZ0725414.1 hypothetical protein [Aerococcus sp. YH-aer222]